MHELAISRSIVEAALRHSRGDRVSDVRLRVGRWTASIRASSDCW
jgi:Zn finger protein HypA/HybF involved in hydrogenase expression